MSHDLLITHNNDVGLTFSVHLENPDYLLNNGNKKLIYKGLDLGGREKRTNEERYQIVSKVTATISDKVRKDVKRCIQRREDTYTRAQTLIEQVAKNKYNSRERDGTTNTKITDKFQKAFDECQIETREYFVCTKEAEPQINKKENKKHNRKIDASAGTKEFYLIDQCPLVAGNCQLFEMYKTLGMKLILSLATNVTNHVPLFSTLLKYNGIQKQQHLKRLTTSIKAHINSFPLKAITMDADAEQKAIALFEASVELDAAVSFTDVVNPKFEEEYLRLNNGKKIKKGPLIKKLKSSLNKRLEMLNILNKHPSYKPISSDAKNQISSLIHDALNRNEFLIVQFLSDINGVEPKLEDLLAENWPIGKQNVWEEQIKRCLKNENVPWADNNENYTYIETSVLWQLQTSKNKILAKGRLRLELIKYALDTYDTDCPPEETVNTAAGTSGWKMSEILMGSDEDYHPWFTSQGRLFKTGIQDNQYFLRKEIMSIYSTVGLNNYLVQAIRDDNVELAQLYLQRGACCDTRGCLNSRIFQEFLQLDMIRREWIPKIVMQDDGKETDEGSYGKLTKIGEAIMKLDIEKKAKILNQQKKPVTKLPTGILGSIGNAFGFGETKNENNEDEEEVDLTDIILAFQTTSFTDTERDELSSKFREIAKRNPGNTSVDTTSTRYNDAISNVGWNGVGATPIHLLIQKEQSETKDALVNSVISQCRKWISQDKHFDIPQAEGGQTIANSIEQIESVEEKTIFINMVSETNKNVIIKGKEAKALGNRKKVMKSAKKKKNPKDKAEVVRTRKERDDNYEAMLMELMKYEGRTLYSEVIVVEKLRDSSVKLEKQAVRGDLKTAMRTAPTPLLKGETKGEVKEEQIQISTYDLYKSTKLRKWDFEKDKFGETYEDGRDCLVDLTGYANATWEIHAMPAFVKYMRKIKKKPRLVNKIVAAIKSVSKGDWVLNPSGTRHCNAKPIPQKGCPGLDLREMKVTKNARIYWELTQGLSVRLSTYGHPIYTDIIRIHSGGDNKNKQDSDIKKIVTSYSRKSQCQLRRELKFHLGQGEGKEGKGKGHGEVIDPKTGLRIPKTYQTIDRDAKSGERGQHLVSLENDYEDGRVVFTQGPAQSDMSQYNLQSAYMLNSEFVASLVYSDEPPEFPIEVEETEAEIIRLAPDPPSSILLLGRSGTGKTTCLVYRMWNEYKTYWEKTGMHMEKRIRSYSVDSSVESSVGDLETKNVFNAEDDELEEHVHHLFMTKSSGLRWEIREQFRKIRATHYNAKLIINQSEQSGVPLPLGKETHDPPFPADRHADDPENLPWSLQKRKEDEPQNHPGVPEEVWPMFLAGHEWLQILDHTLPTWEDQKDDSSLQRFYAFYDHHKKMSEEGDASDSDNDDQDEKGAKNQRVFGSEADDSWFWDLPRPPNDDGDSDDESGSKDLKKINDNDRKANKKEYIEITFDVFQNDFYPNFVAMTKSKEIVTSMSANMVFSEIKSHIQGSVEALETEKGYLSREKYLALGKNRSRLSQVERAAVYTYYIESYIVQRKKESTNYNGWFWDLGSAVHNLWRRFTRMTSKQQKEITKITRIFVDEVQDYTQGELALIIRLSRDPNGCFFCGDTAQNIEKGVDFRFSEIKTLFHDMNQKVLEAHDARKRYKKQQREDHERRAQALNVDVQVLMDQESELLKNINEGETKKDYTVLDNTGFLSWAEGSSIQVPKDGSTFRTLINNFRSHAGVLNLAGTVVELLYQYFPESLDVLPTDRGVTADGPQPVIFKASKVKELEVILSGGGKGDKIDFGVGQAILLREKKCQQNLPAGLKEHPNQFTIRGSKGLEFEDVLIFNFFRDSKVEAKTWRALSEYKDQKDEDKSHLEADQREASWEEFRASLKDAQKIHPTVFDKGKHRALEHELKDLYIAITRAKKNVWFFDDNGDGDYKVDAVRSSTLYQLFKRRGLVMQYGLKDEHGNDTEPMSFTNSSTPEEWAKNAYETKQRAKFTNGDRGKEEMIEKLQRAAAAYRKGNRPNDAYACDGYASEMSATYIAASPAKKQALLYKACQCYAAMKPPRLEQIRSCMSTVRDMEGK